MSSPGDTQVQPDQKEQPHHVEAVERADSPIQEKMVQGLGHDSAGMAVIEQINIIPQTGERMPTTRWEYISFLMMYFQNNGTPIGSQGGNLRMKLIDMQFPDSIIPWGGQHMPMNSFLLDQNGIQFAVNLVFLLLVGPYADYGRWRPWIMISGTVIVTACTFGMIGTYKPSQWQAANALWMLGNLGYSIATTFYQATFPSIARNLPQVLKSEQDVKMGLKTPEEHDIVDQYERSKLYNLCNITGSVLVVIFYGIAIGISYAITHNSTEDGPVIKTFRVLLGYFGVLVLICVVPFFCLHKFRPGQQLPEGTHIWAVGPKQAWQALKSIRQLKHAVLYLIAYTLLQEATGTQWNMTSILQSEHIHFNPVANSAFGLLADLAGGSGTFMLWFQKRFKVSVKTLTCYGGIMALVPIVWGAIGTWTNKIGFHNTWEFWVLQFWNFQTAAWGSYSITMISEVIPAPKAYMFFALFNTISRTSGFTGPFICSAIIKQANGNTNVAYWFLVGLGVLGVAVLFMVDPVQAKIDNAGYLQREAEELYSAHQRAQQHEIVEHQDMEAATGVVSS